MPPRAATVRLAAAAAEAAAARCAERSPTAVAVAVRAGTTAPAAAATATVGVATVGTSALAASAAPLSCCRWSLLRGRAPASHLSWWRRRCYSSTTATTATSAAAAAAEPDLVPLNGAPPLVPASWSAAAATAAEGGPSSPSSTPSLPQHALDAYAALERAAAAKQPEVESRDERAALTSALQRWLSGGGGGGNDAHSATATTGAARRCAQQLLLPAGPLATLLATTFTKLAYNGMTRELAEAIRGGGLERRRQSHNDRNEKQTPPLPWLLLQAHALARFPQAAAARRAAADALNLQSPPLRFPYARALRRRIVYHAGPTNSGKTYSALQALKAAKRGVYCGPLRLLAMEVYERLNAEEGVRCSLVTGQEVLRVPGAQHVACTVEMAALHAHADVAVLDEIQMLGDEQRGAAWTRALLGLPANELHVCGDPSAVGLVASIAAACGDAFELRRYERFAPLEIDAKGLPNGLADVEPGDCVVAFSRRAIFEARKQVEALTGRRAAVVYGALPAETRREQARGFNDPAEGTPQVLVASDAVGLGLNFNIRRVVFHAMTKTIVTTADKLPAKKDKGKKDTGKSGAKNGAREGSFGGGDEGEQRQQRRPSSSSSSKPARPVRLTVPVPVTLVKQIAGRAGRRNSQWPNGLATTLKPTDLPALRRALASPLKALRTPAAGLSPDADALEAVAARLGGSNARLDRVLELWQREVSLDGAGRFFLCDASQLMAVARAVGAIGRGTAGAGTGAGAAGAAVPAPSSPSAPSPLSLADRFTLAAAPVDTADPRCMAAFMRFARDLATGGPVRQPFRWAAEGEDVSVPVAVVEEEEEEEGNGDGRPSRRRRRRPPPPRFPVGGVFLSADAHADDGTPPLRLPTSAPRSVTEMADLEAAHKVLSLWLWLSHRFDPHLFPGRAAVADAAAKLCAWLSDGLRATSELASSSEGSSVSSDKVEEGSTGLGLGGGSEDEQDERSGGKRDKDRRPVPPLSELGAYDWRRRQLWRLLSRRGEWRGVRGGQAYTQGEDEGEEWWLRRRREQQKRAKRRNEAAAAATTTTTADADDDEQPPAADDDALRYAHPPVPADAAALLSPGGGLAGGGGGALAAAALLPRRAAGAAGVPLPQAGVAAAVEGAATSGSGASPSSSSSSSASAAHPHAWLIALGDADPLAALMHSSEWDPSMSRFLRPRQHGRLVIPLPPPPPPAVAVAAEAAASP